MSIFAKIKSSKKAAEQHKAQKAAAVAAEEAVEASKPAAKPYHHRPRHAAQDAISGTPGAANVQAIRAAHQQRAMVQQNAYFSSSSPSLARSYSEASLASRGTTTRPTLMDRRTHPGYASYQHSYSSTYQSRRSSRHGKSPLSSEPITPTDSQTASSASSSSSTRSNTDPIVPSAPFSERLDITSHPSSASLRSVKPPPRTPLYTPKSAPAPRPWEVVAANKAKAAAEKAGATESKVQVNVAELPVQPAPTAVPNPKRYKSFMGLSRKGPAQVAAH